PADTSVMQAILLLVALRPMSRHARRRSEGGGMEVAEPYAGIGDPGHGRGLDRPPEGVHRPVPDIVPDDIQNVRRALPCPGLGERLPVGDRFPDVEWYPAFPRSGHDILLRMRGASYPSRIY